MAVNGVYIVLGEANTVVALLNKARRQYQLSHQPPSSEDTDPLLRGFADLKDVLNTVADISDMNPLTYLSPFLDVIKAQNTNGPITESALSSVAKFLSYGLIDANSIRAANAVEEIAQAAVHTKFIGGKSSGSDECVLFKILLVLRSLLLSPAGRLLSNEAVCDMMQSCFRIVFEQHLSPLLRKAAETTLADTTQLIFTRLPTFREDIRHPYIRQLVMNSKGDKKRRRRRALDEVEDSDEAEDEEHEAQSSTPLEKAVDASQPSQEQATSTAEGESHSVDSSNLDYDIVQTSTSIEKLDDEKGEEADRESESDGEVNKEKVALLKQDPPAPLVSSNSPAAHISQAVHMPYGLPCCRELLRFLIALTNPLDRQNTESMVVLGLNLITIALEAAADHLVSYNFLMPLIKDNLCRSLLQLLDTEKLPVLAATNRVCFLLFESMRSQLKFQLESYFHKLKSIIRSEKNNSYELKEMALESLVQLWRIPGLVTELYLNYDCDLYCSNIFEELTELLKDLSFPMAGLRPTSLLALDALLVVVDTIEQNCVCRQPLPSLSSSSKSAVSALRLPVLSGYETAMNTVNTTTSSAKFDLDVFPITEPLRSNRHAPADPMPAMSHVLEQKERKRILADGTDIFNKEPKEGIKFLREKGLLGSDPESVVNWLRSNPQLDKKKIADYICSRKHADVLETFVKSFPFENTRLDDALRMFLESFRLPGEAAEIAMVMQHFSDHWYKANNEPFNHVDAAFTLSYAIIMLNTDQHNPQVRRNQPPMTVDCFKRNLSGTNGNKDFDMDMLEAMYNAIKNEEIVMPAEQTGTVKENYLWKVLLRRGETSEGNFIHAPSGWNDHALFGLIWAPTISTLSYVFGKTEHDIILKRVLNGYRKCASIAAHYDMENVFDNLVITLCKFSTLTLNDGVIDESEIARQRSTNDAMLSAAENLAISFGENRKAQDATRVLFELVHKNGDKLRDSWVNLLHVLLVLYRARLLPQKITEVDDFVDEKGWVSIVRDYNKDDTPVRNESGLLSWFGLGSGGNETERKQPTADQQQFMKIAAQVINDCRPSQLITDSKYLMSPALTRLITALRDVSGEIAKQLSPNRPMGNEETEDALVLFLELIISITLENRDRLSELWPLVRDHLLDALSYGKCLILMERAIVGLLRIANRNLFRDQAVADDVLRSLGTLLRLPPGAMFMFSRQISFGLYEVLRNNAQDVHQSSHWKVLFSLMEASGAALLPDDIEQSSPDRQAYSDLERDNSRSRADDRGYTSDNTEDRRKTSVDRVITTATSNPSLNQSREWIHLDHKDAARATQDALRALSDSKTFNRTSLVLRTSLGRHEPAAFLKVCDGLDFLLRETAPHVTPENLESSVHCLLTMVEAGLDGGRYAAGPLSSEAQNRLHSTVSDKTQKKSGQHSHRKKDLSVDAEEETDARKEEQQLMASYQQVSLHLLDLCSNLHSRALDKLRGWAAEDPSVDASLPVIWVSVWRPLLQVMARLACDCRRRIRETALAQLQRSFLSMSDLDATEWESCFGEVLFPLLTKLLEPFSAMDLKGMEDTRVRALQIVSKALLNRLRELSSLPSFSSLWLKLLDFMEQYLRIDSCGHLGEAIPETLKNLLLVLDNSGLFVSVPGLYDITTSRLNPVLPQLVRDVLPNPPQLPTSNQSPSDLASLAQAANARVSRVQIAPAIPAESHGSTTSPITSSESNQTLQSSSVQYQHPVPPAPSEIPQPVYVQPTASSSSTQIFHSEHASVSIASESDTTTTTSHSQTSVSDGSIASPSYMSSSTAATPSASVENVTIHAQQQVQQAWSYPVQQQQYYQEQVPQPQPQEQQYSQQQYDAAQAQAAWQYHQMYGQQQQQYAPQGSNYYYPYYTQVHNYHSVPPTQEQQHQPQIYGHDQYSAVNPLMPPQPFSHPVIPSTNSAFQHVSNDQQQHDQNISHERP